MDWALGLIGGLGIGTLLSTVVSYFLSKKSHVAQKLFQEKRDAYFGMTRALYDAEIEPGPKNEKMFGYYLNIAKIFAHKDVVTSAQNVINTNPNTKERIKALESFYETMRKDLHDSI